MSRFPISLGIKSESANIGGGGRKSDDSGRNRGLNGDIGGNHKHEEESRRQRNSGNSRNRVNRGQMSVEDSYEFDVEELNSDIATAMMPFDYSDIGGSKKQEMVVRTFTFVIVMLPTVIAVAVPVMFPHAQANVDLANLITDGIMIVLVSWFIKFTTEWPWKWLKQIKSTKRKLINHVNSTAIINKVSLGNSSDMKLNDEILTKNLFVIKKLINYESLAIACCLFGIILGSLLMLWARNYIIVEESRKKIVFNNLNIGLYIFWGIFRLIMIITESIQRKSIGLLNEGMSMPTFSEYKLITEDNIHMYLPTNKTRDLGASLSTFWGKPQSHLVNQSDAVTEKEHLKDLEHQRIEELESKLEEQSRKMLEITEDSKSQIVEISSSLARLEGSMDTINSQKMVKSLSAESVFLKPFPLNFNIEGNKVYEFQKEPMNTILEEESELENGAGERAFSYENTEPRTPTHIKCMSSNPKLAENMKASMIGEEGSKFFPKSNNLNENDQGNHFSLHGLPFSSSIKELITREVCNDQNDKLPLNANIRNFIDYETEIHNSADFSVEKKKEEDAQLAYIPLFSSFKIIFNTIRNQISVTDIIKNPKSLRRVLAKEIAPTILQVTEDNFDAYVKNLGLVKGVMRELIYKYVISNVDSLRTYFVLLDIKYLAPLRKGKIMAIIILTKIPFNIVRIQFNIIFFVPKALIKFFIISPMVASTRKNAAAKKTQDIRGNSFDGIKEFHLSSMDHNRYLQQFVEGIPSIKARRVLLSKLAKHCEIDQSFEKEGNYTPVALYEER